MGARRPSSLGHRQSVRSAPKRDRRAGNPGGIHRHVCALAPTGFRARETGTGMESLRTLPPVLHTVEVPPTLIATRLASSGDCSLKAIILPSAYPNWPSSPEAAFGRVVHFLMDLAAQ